MLSAAASFDFAAQFVAMVVAASGLVLVVLRTDLVRRSAIGRSLLVVGFAALVAVAFVRGARLGGSGDLVGAFAIVGAGLVAGGSAWWQAGRRSRWGLVAGGALVAVAAAAGIGGAPTVASDTVLVVGSIVVAGALVAAGKRSIAVRVATNAAATLLLVVLVVSVALSSVITSSVEHQELVQLRSRAAVQAREVLASADNALGGARLVASGLEGSFSSSGPGLARVAAGAGSGKAEDHDLIVSRLRTLASFYPDVGIGFVPIGDAPIAAGSGLPSGSASLPAATGLSCRPGATGSAGHRSVVTAGKAAFAVGAFAVCVAAPRRQVGAVITAVPLGSAYLSGIRSSATGASLAFVGSSGLVASVGVRPTAGILAEAETEARSAGALGATAVVRDNRFVAVVPVSTASASRTARPALWLVASSPTTSLAGTRDSLLRALFIIALGGTLLSLVLAAATGERITSGIRRLTAAARSVRESGITPHSGVASDDEVGVLAVAFDAMVDSAEENSGALRHAAAEETRLRNRLEAVIAGMGDALVAVDGLGRITDFNRAAEELTGVSAATAIGARAGDVIVLSGDGGRRLSAPGESIDAAAWAELADLIRPDRSTVPVAVSSGAVRGPVGEEIGRVLVLRDLRREQEVERMKSEFLSRVGHELRTPLTGILGYADLLVHRDVPPEAARGWHAEILESAKRQMRIVGLLEFFASSGAGRLVVRPEAVSVRAFVTDVVSGWSERLPPSHQLSSRVSRALPDVMADARWLRLAVDEVIDNAVKFSPAGGRIQITAALVPAGGGTETPGASSLDAVPSATGGPGVVASGGAGPAAMVEIAVVDHGRGMTPDERARAFGAFEQGDASDTRGAGGLGLGLAVVAQVVTDHGGSLGCRSRPGAGTTVSLRLRAAAHGQDPGAADGTAPAPSHPVSPRTRRARSHQAPSAPSRRPNGWEPPPTSHVPPRW